MTNSHTALIEELTETRRHLWMAIAKGKQFAHLLPAREKAELLAALMDGERFIAGGIKNPSSENPAGEFGSTAKLRRRLSDAGEEFYEEHGKP